MTRKSGVRGVYRIERLSAQAVARCTKIGHLGDGGGLYLQVSLRKSKAVPENARPSERLAKSWVFRYQDRVTKKQHELGLGSYPDVSLAEARERAGELRKQLRDGLDPKAVRAAKRNELKAAAQKVITFDKAAEQCIESKKAGWSNTKHADQWTNTIKSYASPVFGSLPVSDIDTALVMKALEPIWTIKNETASRLRQRIEAVLSWATTSGYRSGENPARWRGHLENLLSKPSKVQDREHHPALPHAEVAAFIRQLSDLSGISSKALEFTILTAARTGEVVGARWEEVDKNKQIWTIPASRMKAKKEHTIPLCSRAMEIINELERLKTSAYIFPSTKADQPISNMAMNATLKRMNRTDITVHGFRSTFRDWAGEETSHPREVIEHALAHQLKDKAEAAYARGTLLEKRRALMQDWEAHCLAPEAPDKENATD